MQKSIAVVFLVAMAFLSHQARALTINTTFDPSVTGMANAAQWISGWNYAAGQFQSQYADPITINITFQAVAGTGGTSTSNIQDLGGASDYSVMRAALIADATTANDVTAIANLPLVDPTGGRLFVATFANAKALGFRSANNPATDGIVTIGLNNAYTFDPNNRAVPGTIDFIGLAEHEISEVMGRIGLLGQTLGTGFNLDTPIDLFGFNSIGNRNFNQNQPNVYFSIDNGVTHLRVYNDHTNGGDDKDWANGQGGDAFNAFGFLGLKQDMSVVDMQTMDVIGYNLVPEPSSLALAMFGLLALKGVRNSRRLYSNRRFRMASVSGGLGPLMK